jgi:hypothetical protein
MNLELHHLLLRMHGKVEDKDSEAEEGALIKVILV